MKRSVLQRKTSLKSHSSLKRSYFKHKKLDFKSEIPLNPKLVLDSVFSEVIRRESADERGLVACYTCGIWKFWKEMQCGHFRPRQHLATRYDEENSKPQCEDCNCFKDGNLEEFGYRLSQEYGPEFLQQIYEKSESIVVDFPWKEKLEIYRKRLAALVGAQENIIQY